MERSSHLSYLLLEAAESCHHLLVLLRESMYPGAMRELGPVRTRQDYRGMVRMHLARFDQYMNSMKLVIPLHSLYWSIHTKDESKRGSVFAFIVGVN